MKQAPAEVCALSTDVVGVVNAAVVNLNPCQYAKGADWLVVGTAGCCVLVDLDTAGCCTDEKSNLKAGVAWCSSSRSLKLMQY